MSFYAVYSADEVVGDAGVFPGVGWSASGGDIHSRYTALACRLLAACCLLIEEGLSLNHLSVLHALLCLPGFLGWLIVAVVLALFSFGAW